MVTVPQGIQNPAYSPPSTHRVPECHYLDFELQFTPNRTASTELKESVARAFADRALRVERWTTSPEDDRKLPRGVNWAEPTLDVRVLGGREPAQAVITRLPSDLAAALVHIGQDYARLGLFVQVIGADRTIRLAVRRADPAETWLDAVEALRAGELGQGTANVYGWDAVANLWSPI